MLLSRESQNLELKVILNVKPNFQVLPLRILEGKVKYDTSIKLATEKVGTLGKLIILFLWKGTNACYLLKYFIIATVLTHIL